ncbi:MAG: hypothetical protein ACYTAF_01575, partial [Planctomycetota bacterium]
YEDYSSRATHYWIVTVSQVQALRAARRTGFYVPMDCINRAIKFVKTKKWCMCSAPCYGMDGALVVTLLAAGDYENPEIVKHIKDVYGKVQYDYTKLKYPVFTHLYCAQALNFDRKEMWRTYYRKLRDYLLKVQVKHGGGEGYWNRMYRSHSERPPDKVYATAVACLILQMPSYFLPMLEYR